jgi:hypothetical protein
MPGYTDQQSLAFVVSFEKLFNSDALVIRIANISKYDPLVMTSFKWDPKAPSGSGVGSITHEEKTIYLVKKNNGRYSRVNNYEVLNTEIRSLLFKHSYGYDLTLVDFGRLSSMQANTLQLGQVPALPPSEIPPVRASDPTAGLNFLFRDFGIIRVRSVRKTPPVDPLRDNNQAFSGDEDQLSAVEEDMNQTRQEQAEADFALDDPTPATFENHYALFSFYDDYQCLSRGELFVLIKVAGGAFESIGPQKLLDVHSQVLKVTPEEYLTRMSREAEKVCRAVMDHLIIEKVAPTHPESALHPATTFQAVLDTKLPPMSDVLKYMKEEKQKLRLDENDICNQEYASPRALGITLNVLAECQKKTQVSIINRKLFKVTSYFVSNMKNLKMAGFTEGPPERFFDFQLIYIDAETRTSTKSLPIVVTEKDIRTLVNLANNRQTGGEYKVLKDPAEILSLKVSRSKLLEFILDSLVIDEELQQLKMSITHLLSRLQDRILLNHYFRI